MANKRHKLEEIVQKLRQVDVLVVQGMQCVDAIREVRVTEQTYYRWRKQYPGIGTDQLKNLFEFTYGLAILAVLAVAGFVSLFWFVRWMDYSITLTFGIALVLLYINAMMRGSCSSRAGRKKGDYFKAQEDFYPLHERPNHVLNPMAHYQIQQRLPNAASAWARLCCTC